MAYGKIKYNEYIIPSIQRIAISNGGGSFWNQDFPQKIWKSRNKFVSLHPIGNEGNKSMATDKVAYWLDIADYDLDTAEAFQY